MKENEDYRNSHLGSDKAHSYHQQFKYNKYRAMIWDKEKIILNKIVKKNFSDGVSNYLDFACGTGRILGFLSKYAREITGVDLSESMLEIAKKSTPDSAQLICEDITKNDTLNDNKYDLITAFRFFPNAQRELRNSSMQVLIKHLTDDGILVFNNHKNHTSFLYTLARLFRGKAAAITTITMKHSEVKLLCDEHGLKIIDTYHTGIIPSFERFISLPFFLFSPLESFLSRIKILKYFAFNVVYVCKFKS